MECSTPINFSLMVNFSSLWGWGGATGHLLATYWSHCCTLCVWELVALPDALPFFCRLRVWGGNCLFAAIKASMNVHHSNSKDAPYYPMRYFRRQVVAWMIKHHQLVMANKGVALMANYGLEEEDGQFKGPLSYKQYLQHVLQCRF